jgi:pyruvate dehydrogenase E2 component (dihydrolipoamide acetyltransferase)
MEVLMPQLGETVAEGKITTWFKSLGDAVKSGDNLFEIETDKVSMEVPSITSGVLAEIRVKVGEIAPVGGIVAVISESGGAAAAPVTRAPAPAVKLEPFKEVRTPEHNYGPAKLANGFRTTPLARRLAREAGLDLSGLQGSGPGGRIIAKDVQAAAASATRELAVVPVAPPAEVVYQEIPLDAMRKTIAKRLTEAQTIPHFYLAVDVEVDRLLALREEVNAGPGAVKISINDFVIKAYALALQRVPAANSIWADDRILRFKHSEIGVAVALEGGGLLTPLIRQAEMKSLSAISAEMKDLAARAREKKLKPHEYQGGSAAISNLGMYGVHQFAAILNPPHATILAVGAAVRRPVEAPNGGIRFVTQMTVTLSCDHRVVDGATGAELLAAFKALIENPISMLV